MPHMTAKVMARTTPREREGDSSPELNGATSYKRSKEGKSWKSKTIDRYLRRRKRKEEGAAARAEEEGLERQIAFYQKQRAAFNPPEITDTPSPLLVIGTPLQPLKRRKAPQKPSKRVISTSKRVRRHSECSPIILEQRKARAEFREVKRMFKKILKFALIQGKKYGHAFCIAVLELFCMKIQPMVIEN